MKKNRTIVFLSKILSHFETMASLCTKTGLLKSLRKFYSSNQECVKAHYSAHHTIPTSYLLKSGLEDCEYTNFIKRYNEIESGNYGKETLSKDSCQNNIWLVKPANMNQGYINLGKGIKVCKDLKEIESHISSKKPGSIWVCQKYIEKPLLYYGRKFDIRMWCLITNSEEVFIKSFIIIKKDISERAPSNIL